MKQVKAIVTLRGLRHKQVKVKVIVTLRDQQRHPGDHSSLRGQSPAAASPAFTISAQLEDDCAQAEGPALIVSL